VVEKMKDSSEFVGSLVRKRWIRRSVLAFVIGVIVVSAFTHLRQAWVSPYYRELHGRVNAKSVASATITNFNGPTVRVERPDRLEELGAFMHDLEMTSLFKPRRSSCTMAVSLKDGKKIYYHLFLDMKKTNVIVSIHGDDESKFEGFSMGYLESRDSRFFDWLRQTIGFGVNPEEIRYCSNLTEVAGQ
jgi:hypothetical protein